MNEIQKHNQEVVQLFLKSQKKKEVGNEILEKHTNNLKDYITDYLDNKTFKNGYELVVPFLKTFLPNKYPLLSYKMIESYIDTLKKFYTYMYGLSEITYEDYAKTFDQLVYQGDEIIEKYKKDIQVN